MGQVWALKVPRDHRGKRTWHEIGLGVEQPRGAGISCTLFSVPLNWDGTFALFPVDKERRTQRQAEADFVEADAAGHGGDLE